MAVFPALCGLDAKSYTCGIVGKEKMNLAIRLDSCLYGWKENGGVKDEQIGELVGGATEQRDIGELVGDMPEDSYGGGLMADQCGPAGSHAVMPVAVEQFPSSGFVAEREGMVELFFPIIPCFEAILLCHWEGNASFPKEAFEVSGSNGMCLLEGDLGNAVASFGGMNLLHGENCGLEYAGEFADGAVKEANGEIGKAAGLSGAGLPPAVAMTIDDKGGPVNAMAGERG